MSATSITLSDITYTAPDGRPLFTDLSLTFGEERAGLVGRNGVGKTSLFRLLTGELVPSAGSVTMAGRPGWLRQEVASPQATLAELFGVREALDILGRAAAGEATLDELAEADWTLEERLAATLSRLGIEGLSPDTRLDTLSGGQRTRARLAALVFEDPDILLLDEPTNNLDRDGREAVIDLLSGWRKAAVVISHDRELLDAMDAIVELTTLGATRYGGNGSHYREQKALALAAAEHGLASAERQLDETTRSARESAEKKARRDRAGRLSRRKGDQPKVLLDARKERSEGTTSTNARLAEARIGRAQEAAETARQRIEVLESITMTLPSTGLPAGRTVLIAANVSAGYAPDTALIEDFSLTLTGPERVAIGGPNGAGKSTLLATLTAALPPLAGTVRLDVPYARLDQSAGRLDPGLTVRENFRRLQPDIGENDARAALARFLFRGEDALQLTGTLSGGQRFRAGLACVLGGPIPPQLLILDEPTNHLDLDALEALESALNSYDGALLVVSHDTAFLDALGLDRRIELTGRPKGVETQ